jgi:hypothetical protein
MDGSAVARICFTSKTLIFWVEFFFFFNKYKLTEMKDTCAWVAFKFSFVEFTFSI